MTIGINKPPKNPKPDVKPIALEPSAICPVCHRKVKVVANSFSNHMKDPYTVCPNSYNPIPKKEKL